MCQVVSCKEKVIGSSESDIQSITLPCKIIIIKIIIFLCDTRISIIKMNICLRVILLKGVGWINYSKSLVWTWVRSSPSQRRDKSKSEGLVNFVIRENSNQ